MAGLVPAIHVLSRRNEFADARDKPGHDEFVEAAHFIFAIACIAAT
ncbi:hypothetical protein ABIB94_002966 [Bradyrhizobium sp. JR7.2]